MKKKRRTGSGFSREEKEFLARLNAGYDNMDDMIRILLPASLRLAELADRRGIYPKPERRFN